MSQLILPIHSHLEYFKSLLEDNVDRCRQVLEFLDAQKLHNLLQGEFAFETKQGNTKYDEFLQEKRTSKMFCRMKVDLNFNFYSRPLIIAALAGSSNVTEYLLQQSCVTGITIVHLTQQSNQENVLHAIAKDSRAIQSKGHKASQVMDLICSYSSHHTILHLLLQENYEGLRPLELSIKYGEYEFFHHILTYPGLHLKREEMHGLHLHCVFDVSEYGVYGERFTRSPFHFLRHVNMENAKHLTKCYLLQTPVMVAWTDAVLSSKLAYVWLFVWLLLRIAMCIGVVRVWNIRESFAAVNLMEKLLGNLSLVELMSINNELNSYDPQLKPILASFYLTIIVWIGYFLLTLQQFYFNRNIPWKYSSTIRNESDKFMDNRDYRFFRIVSDIGLFIMASILLVFENTHQILNITTLQICFINWLVFGFMGFIYFLAVFLPKTDSKAVIIFIRLQRILFQNGKIMVYLSLFFVFPFFGLLNDNLPDDYKDYGTSLYSLVKIMLNVVPDSFRASLGYSFVYLHCLFIFIVVIVLMNMLLSVMTEYMENFAHFVPLYQKLLRLDAFLLMEERIGWMCRKLLPQSKKKPMFLYVKRDVLLELSNSWIFAAETFHIDSGGEEKSAKVF